MKIMTLVPDADQRADLHRLPAAWDVAKHDGVQIGTAEPVLAVRLPEDADEDARAALLAVVDRIGAEADALLTAGTGPLKATGSCLVCGVDLPATGRGRPRVFCSAPECRRTARAVRYARRRAAADPKRLSIRSRYAEQALKPLLPRSWRGWQRPGEAERVARLAARLAPVEADWVDAASGFEDLDGVGVDLPSWREAHRVTFYGPDPDAEPVADADLAEADTAQVAEWLLLGRVTPERARRHAERACGQID